ncbi:hypothetical protein PIB30_043327 [Stylosanthes scabra]|uniref:Uncharacterized protein n=1 Tax=Stylosanthes scabra TaxID=79078 RepID=A0ABU6TF56_9FABA|nr:hypothetical protein [Stylosanthes scabra]
MVEGLDRLPVYPPGYETYIIDGCSGWALSLEALPSRYQSLERCHRGVTKFESTEYETQSARPWIEILCVPMITTDPRLHGLSLKENELPQGGRVNPYPKILGIHNSGGSGSYDKTRVNPASPG